MFEDITNANTSKLNAYETILRNIEKRMSETQDIIDRHEEAITNDPETGFGARVKALEDDRHRHYETISEHKQEICTKPDSIYAGLPCEFAKRGKEQ